MANKKISALTSATLPLAGTEVLPIVQSSTTNNISVNSLAAGNLKSQSTTGVLQVSGPSAGTTRVMTVPDANFTAARTDAGQTFTGNQQINGLVSLSTSPSAWQSNWSVLEFPGVQNIAVRYGVTWVNQNAYINSGGAWTYGTSSTAAQLQVGAGTLDLNVAVSGTAGNAITWITGVHIGNTGGVSVGNTTDPGASNLSVTGNILGGSGKSFIANGNRTYYSAAGFWDDTVQGNACGIGCFGGPAVGPLNGSGSATDNTVNLGSATYRWKTVYAGTSTINTSDANEKQDIVSLDDAELAVAKQIKSLIKKFKFKDAVEQKGSNARIHFGVIAQEIESAFAAQNLDASKYGLFCKDEWYEVDGKTMDENMKPYTANTNLAVKKTRLGVRYEELFAFVIAAM